jgi:polysaccharide deacetylase family protein (PEP-CTERM system associated)
MNNAVTIDLEDYYQVSAFSSSVSIEEWGSRESRIESNTARILDILDVEQRRATFFTLGWVAKQYPGLLKEIAGRRHEIACHSNSHRYVYAQTPEEFRADTLQAKRLLENASGSPVLGYRAPSFSITRNSLWAFEILAELGFTYDSSVFPIKHPNYGMQRAPRHPFSIRTPSGLITEFPMPTLEMGGVRAPLGGGAYLRFLPYWYTRWGIRYLNTIEKRLACVYLHPWELDPKQPRMNGSITARMRHYFGLRSAESKFRRLLHDFEFQPLGAFVGAPGESSSHQPSSGMPEISLAELGAYLGEH